MRKNFFVSLAATFFLVTSNSFANDVPADEAVSPSVVEGVVPGAEEKSDDVSRDVFWDFITCTHTDHECLHEAQHHGFPHYRAIHGDSRCFGHAHYGCYGGHH